MKFAHARLKLSAVRAIDRDRYRKTRGTLPLFLCRSHVVPSSSSIRSILNQPSRAVSVLKGWNVVGIVGNDNLIVVDFYRKEGDKTLSWFSMGFRYKQFFFLPSNWIRFAFNFVSNERNLHFFAIIYFVLLQKYITCLKWDFDVSTLSYLYDIKIVDCLKLNLSCSKWNETGNWAENEFNDFECYKVKTSCRWKWVKLY